MPAPDGSPSSRLELVMRSLYAAAGAAAAAAVRFQALVPDGHPGAPGRRERQLERQGFWQRRSSCSRGDWIWIHASSVGEADLALALARQLAASLPDARMVVSSMTATGRARVLEDPSVESHWFPVDYAPFIKRILNPVPPRLFVAIETEIWPATLQVLAAGGVPITFANARISDASLPRYRRLAPLVAPILANVARVCARDEEAAARWRSLGVPPGVVTVTGNMKFDLAAGGDAAAAPLFEAGVPADVPLVLAASTHDGEERLAVDAFVRLRERNVSARLAIAPRHPDRAAAVRELVRSRGLPVALLSEVPQAATPDSPARWPGEVDAVVIDRLGVLRRAYASAAAAFVGGSAVEGPGGHNLVEAVLAGRAALAAGAHLENVRDQADVLLAAGALRLVTNVEQLATFWTQAIEQPALFDQANVAARAAVEARCGALERTASALVELVRAAPVAHGGGASRGAV